MQKFSVGRDKENKHYFRQNWKLFNVCMYVYLALNGYNKEKEEFFYNWYNFLENR